MTEDLSPECREELERLQRAHERLAREAAGIPAPAAPVPAASGPESGRSELGEALVRQLDRYFEQLGGRRPHPLYELVLDAVERPLLEYVMERCSGNQCAAAKLLGINRNTLRKKLADHGMLPYPKRSDQ